MPEGGGVGWQRGALLCLPARTAGRDLGNIFGLGLLGLVQVARISRALATKLCEDQGLSASFFPAFKHFQRASLPPFPPKTPGEHFAEGQRPVDPKAL